MCALVIGIDESLRFYRVMLFVNVANELVLLVRPLLKITLTFTDHVPTTARTRTSERNKQSPKAEFIFRRCTKRILSIWRIREFHNIHICHKR